MDNEPSRITALLREAAVLRRVPWPLVAVAAVAVLLSALIGFGHEIMEGDGHAIDRALMLAMRAPGNPARPWGPGWLPSAVRDVTALGSTIVLTLVVGIVATFLVLKRQRRTALLVVAATLSGATVVTLVKQAVARTRPDVVQQLMAETSHSFPSGHAANSAVVYLTMAALLFPVLRDWRMRMFVVAVALLLVGLIGVTRVYLGVHWPSDVLAGWAFGSCWALLWWGFELWLLRRRTRP